jgi:hypothetical protein
MFRLQAAIIRQTFQYMDMTCSVVQNGIPYCVHLFKCLNFHTANVHNMGSHTVALNMYRNVCLMMAACNRNM